MSDEWSWTADCSSRRPAPRRTERLDVGGRRCNESTSASIVDSNRSGVSSSSLTRRTPSRRSRRCGHVRCRGSTLDGEVLRVEVDFDGPLQRWDWRRRSTQPPYEGSTTTHLAPSRLGRPGSAGLRTRALRVRFGRRVRDDGWPSTPGNAWPMVDLAWRAAAPCDAACRRCRADDSGRARSSRPARRIDVPGEIDDRSRWARQPDAIGPSHDFVIEDSAVRYGRNQCSRHGWLAAARARVPVRRAVID